MFYLKLKPLILKNMSAPKLSSSPIIERPFWKSRIVICGTCSGNKLIANEDNSGFTECHTCKGAGTLEKVTEGTVKLFINK